MLSTHLDPAHHPQRTGNEEVTRMWRWPGLLVWVSESVIDLPEYLIIFCLRETGRLMNRHLRLILSTSHFLTAVHLSGLFWGLSEWEEAVKEFCTVWPKVGIQLKLVSLMVLCNDLWICISSKSISFYMYPFWFLNKKWNKKHDYKVLMMWRQKSGVILTQDKL